MRKWLPIIVLGLANFVMVVDGTVMNVSIMVVVADLDTTVSSMQLAIATFWIGWTDGLRTISSYDLIVQTA